MSVPHPDSRTSSTRSRALPCALALCALLAAPAAAHGAVESPPDGYAGYYDAAGVYTVVGNVRNGFEYPVLPTVTVRVSDGGAVASETFRHVPLDPGGELPFKVRFPGVQSPEARPLPPEVAHERVQKDPVPVSVIYDETLVLHEDGHLTGRVQNTGDRTVHNPKIFAVVHGHGGVLDVAQNIGMIGSLAPGEVAEFAMYPDPSITVEVSHYSCFGPVDTTVVPVSAEKGGGRFDFRYDSTAWFHSASFDGSGTIMTMRGYNSYPLETYVNFEFPPVSGDEEFAVSVNGEPVDFVQSIDEEGMWHVAYTVGPSSQSVVSISGFAEGLPEGSGIPAWVRQSAGWWAEGQVDDAEFLEAVGYLVGIGELPVPPDGAAPGIPAWARAPAGWWAEGRIGDEEFVGMLDALVRLGFVGV